MTDELTLKNENSISSISEMSTLKCKKPTATTPVYVTAQREENEKEDPDDLIDVLEPELDCNASSKLVVPIKETNLTRKPVFRIRDPRLGPSLRPRGSKRSTMTWPGCR